MNGADKPHGTDEECIVILVSILKIRVHIGVHGRIMLQWILCRQSVRVWNGLIWLRLGTSGTHL
jgi:hypothetical protein